MVLKADVTFMVFTTEVIQQLECERPFLLRELRVLEHVGPCRSPKVVLDCVFTILTVNNSALIYHDLTGVPLTVTLEVLGIGRDHIVERRALAIAVLAEFGVGVVGIVEDLVLRSRDVDRLHAGLTFLILALDLLCKHKHT